MLRHSLLLLFDELKKQVRKGLLTGQIGDVFSQIYAESLQLLSSADREELISRVFGKRYIAFCGVARGSRAINADLFEPDVTLWTQLLSEMQTGEIVSFNSDQINRVLYSLAISFCASVDLIKEGDQQTPGTFFQYFVAFIVAWRLGVEPTTSIQILSIDQEDTRLPTDFIFNPGPKQRKFHVPIKTSSRERSIMLWAHQKLIDGVYGVERFMGTPVMLAETKLDKASREVIEICLPEQWRMYQLYIARLKRIYYLDIPAAYARLNAEFPPLEVRPFGDFLFEWKDLTPG